MQLEVVLWSLDVYYYSFQRGTGSLGPFCLTCLAWDQGRRPWSHSQTTGCTFNLIIRVKHCLPLTAVGFDQCSWKSCQGAGYRLPSQETPSFPWTADPCSPESLCHPATCWILKSPHQAWWFLPGFWLHLSGFLRFPTHKIWYVHICPGSQIIPGQIWASALQTAQNPQPMTPGGMPPHSPRSSVPPHQPFPGTWIVSSPYGVFSTDWCEILQCVFRAILIIQWYIHRHMSHTHYTYIYIYIDPGWQQRGAPESGEQQQQQQEEQEQEEQEQEQN